MIVPSCSIIVFAIQIIICSGEMHSSRTFPAVEASAMASGNPWNEFPFRHGLVVFLGNPQQPAVRLNPRLPWSITPSFLAVHFVHLSTCDLPFYCSPSVTRLSLSGKLNFYLPLFLVLSLCAQFFHS